jgi:hypothetical protein
MKTRLIFLVLLIVCFSCGTNNKPVSDTQKEKIKGEVKDIVKDIIQDGENANIDKSAELWFDSPEFVYINDGTSSNYKEFIDDSKSYFSTLIGQKCTIMDEKYIVLNNSTVLYSANNKWVANFKDGHSILSDPWAWSIIIKKIDKKWKAIYFAESGLKQSIKNTETSKELNQVELIKQLVGSWKCDIGKDTTAFVEYKSYGTGLEGYVKYMTKGKIVMEGKQLWGFDKSDEGIGVQMTKGFVTEIYAFWWISKNKYVFIPYNEISNPEKAPFKDEGEFKSPDVLVTTVTENNRPIITHTYTRVK